MVHNKFVIISFLLIQVLTGVGLHGKEKAIKDYNSIAIRAPFESLANQYPNDLGIESDSNVLYTEMFVGDIAAISRRYSYVKNKDGMSVSSKDIPAGSRGQALMITNMGGKNDGGHLYRTFKPGLDSTIYIRYYVKYPLSSKGYIHHESVRLGGHYPVSDYPFGQAGLCGLGDKRISISYEPINEPVMDTYIYWGDMKSWNGGTSCYGNDLVNGSPTAQDLKWDEWTCIELMIKMNNPVTASNGELKVWQDDKLVGRWGPGFPNGHWDNDSWINKAGDPAFSGFRWRTNPYLNINYLLIEFYDDTSPLNVSHHIKYSNIVVARKYIGPIRKQ